MFVLQFLSKCHLQFQAAKTYWCWEWGNGMITTSHYGSLPIPYSLLSINGLFFFGKSKPDFHRCSHSIFGLFLSIFPETNPWTERVRTLGGPARIFIQLNLVIGLQSQERHANIIFDQAELQSFSRMGWFRGISRPKIRMDLVMLILVYYLTIWPKYDIL